jgi:methionine sulfoxide reductase catalytic subunit
MHMCNAITYEERRNGGTYRFIVFHDLSICLRFVHFINLIFITLLIISGIEILSSLPKLYFNDYARSGSEWIKFTRKQMPEDRMWISLDEEEEIIFFLDCFAKTQELGLRRRWHFFSANFLDSNGAAYYILLFTSDEWQRFIPTSWNIFRQVFHISLS